MPILIGGPRAEKGRDNVSTKARPEAWKLLRLRSSPTCPSKLDNFPLEDDDRKKIVENAKYPRLSGANEKNWKTRDFRNFIRKELFFFYRYTQLILSREHNYT